MAKNPLDWESRKFIAHRANTKIVGIILEVLSVVKYGRHIRLSNDTNIHIQIIIEISGLFTPYRPSQLKPESLEGKGREGGELIFFLLLFAFFPINWTVNKD